MPTLGGSLPLHDLVDVLAVPTVILPIANPDNNQHAANENLRVGQLWYGVVCGPCCSPSSHDSRV